jgi:uncharacterized membrane protein
MTVFRVREWARSSLLFVPAVITVGLVGLSIAALRLDDAFSHQGWWPDLFRGGPDTARSVLSTIAAATVTLTALVFSITMLVLQLASTQYSPRVLRTFLSDTNSKVTLGIFVGTFAYELSVLRGLDANDPEASTPDLAMSIGVALALVVLGAFVQYVNHMAHRVRVETIVTSISDETRRVIDDRYRASEHWRNTTRDESFAPDLFVLAQSRGILVAVDSPALVTAASNARVRVRVLLRPGEFAPRGAPVLALSTMPGSAIDEEKMLEALAWAPDRTLAQDPAFGFRQLVDIALRALSPSMNDPTTAVETLDEIHDLLRELAGRERLGDRAYCDADGNARVVVPDRTWDDYLDLAVDEVIHYGRDHPQVNRRVSTLLHDLSVVAPGARAGAAQHKLAQLG